MGRRNSSIACQASLVPCCGVHVLAEFSEKYPTASSCRCCKGVLVGTETNLKLIFPLDLRNPGRETKKVFAHVVSTTDPERIIELEYTRCHATMCISPLVVGHGWGQNVEIFCMSDVVGLLYVKFRHVGWNLARATSCQVPASRVSIVFFFFPRK